MKCASVVPWTEGPLCIDYFEICLRFCLEGTDHGRDNMLNDHCMLPMSISKNCCYWGYKIISQQGES